MIEITFRAILFVFDTNLQKILIFTLRRCC